jgi:sterol desaturase/sphingolipid hydroxylase (fatty acid hydroxylase superfamily)
MLILIEMGVSIFLLKDETHRVRDTYANLTLAVADSITTNFAWYALMFVAWEFVFQHSPLRLNDASPATWVLAVILSDLSFYIYHRASHRTRLFWAIHCVHHTSRHYNLSVALRLSCLEGAIRWPFWIILPAAGISPKLTLLSYLAVRLYQIPLHTRYVGKLGIMEKSLLATPSIHRVHHAINPAYIDKNYGGITTIWDRIFSTFELEREPVVYGTPKPIDTDNPVKITFDELTSLLRDVVSARSMSGKLRLLFMPPGWCPAIQNLSHKSTSHSHRRCIHSRCFGCFRTQPPALDRGGDHLHHGGDVAPVFAVAQGGASASVKLQSDQFQTNRSSRSGRSTQPTPSARQLVPIARWRQARRYPHRDGARGDAA